MNILVISNMAPSPAYPVRGMFVENQVNALKQMVGKGTIEHVEFLAIRSVKTGKLAVLLKYFKLLLSLFTVAIFRRKRFDIVHVHYFYPTIWFAIAYRLLRFSRCKIVVTFHGADIYLHPQPSKLYRMASRFVDHHIFVSQGSKQQYFQQDNIESTIISAGILNCYQPQPTEKKYDVIMIGTIEHNKGIDRLMDLIRTLAQSDLQGEALKVAVIGEGELNPQLAAFAVTHPQVDFLGRCTPPQIVGYLNQSRYLLSLSREEAFGLVMTEAMACGVPVIATATPGAMTQVTPGVNGYLIDNDQDYRVEQLAQTLTSALQLYPSEQYQALAANAKDYAQTHQLSNVMRQILAIYQTLPTDGAL